MSRLDTPDGAKDDNAEEHVLTFTNDPSKGVPVGVNGAGGPEIAGADFATTLLSISIGAAPPNPEIGTGLLGGKCP